MSFGIMTMRDYSGLLQQRSLEGLSITDGTEYTAAQAAWAAFIAAVGDLTEGVVAESNLLTVEASSATHPASGTARTNHHFIVHYHQDLDPSKNRTFRIPTADLNDETIFQGLTTRLDPAHTDVAALITAFEAWALIEGTSVTIDFIEYEND